ncbi:phage integrase SAM-like domain-containing protein [Elizabethkingia occulta]|uniref:phage integrase SAM-like domain-containing protein n=1 Tax=Elizabethkingia occulta TaxID=1867263 RepID=UPI00398C7A1B
MVEEFNNELGTIRFYLKDKKSLIPTLLKGAYLFKNFNIGFSTGIKLIPDKEWNENEKIVIAGKNKRDYNEKLSKFKLSITQSHKNFNDNYNRIPTKEELKSIVKSAIEGGGIKAIKKQKKNFEEVYQEILELLISRQNNALEALKRGEQARPLHKSYISSFKIAFEQLKEFATKTSLILDIDTFDEQQCLNFQNWLIKEKKIRQNTVKTRIKRINLILKRAFEKGYTEKRAYLLDEFKVKVPQTISTSFTEPEIKLLYEFDFSQNKRLERIRDLFILACHTSLRFSDVNRLQLEHINIDTESISIVSQKTSTSTNYKNLNFNFFGFTKDILEKYNYDIRQLAISNQKTNEYLKELLENIPYFKEKTFKIEILTNNGIKFNSVSFIKTVDFHTSRRSFCTNRYCEGWELMEIWDYTGHTNESTFKTYFRPTSEHEKIRRDNIKNRNEKLKNIDFREKEFENLKNQMQEILKLHQSGDLEKMGKLIELNQKTS